LEVETGRLRKELEEKVREQKELEEKHNELHNSYRDLQVCWFHELIGLKALVSSEETILSSLSSALSLQFLILFLV